VSVAVRCPRTSFSRYLRFPSFRCRTDRSPTPGTKCFGREYHPLPPIIRTGAAFVRNFTPTPRNSHEWSVPPLSLIPQFAQAASQSVDYPYPGDRASLVDLNFASRFEPPSPQQARQSSICSHSIPLTISPRPLPTPRCARKTMCCPFSCAGDDFPGPTPVVREGTLRLMSGDFLISLTPMSRLSLCPSPTEYKRNTKKTVIDR